MRIWGWTVLLVACLARAMAPVHAADVNTSATLIYYDMAGNETLDPAETQNNSSYSHEALLAIYEPLIRLNDAGNPEGGLAESWTRNGDLTEITLKPRHGVTFDDGTKFDAEAVKRNLERSATLGRRAGTTVFETLNLVSAIELQGDDGVKLKLKAPSGQIEFWLGSNPGMMISPASLTEGAIGPTLNPVGAGPYKLKRFDANVTTFTVRFEDYWGGTKNRPAGFEHHYVPDGRARLNALRSGQANIALIDPRQIPEAKAAGLAIQVVEKNARC